MSTFASPQRQIFSIPYNFILYILENPDSPEGLEKLYETCKFFFAKNPILLPSDLIYKKDGIYYGFFESFHTFAKFWPTRQLLISNKIDYNKFYRFSPEDLTISEIALSVKEFDLLIAENTVKKFWIAAPAIIMHSTVGEILGKLPKANNFFYCVAEEVYSLETIQNLNLLQRQTKLTCCSIGIPKISNDFDPSLFVIFLAQNIVSNSKFQICFSDILAMVSIRRKFIDGLKEFNDKYEIDSTNVYVVSVNFL